MAKSIKELKNEIAGLTKTQKIIRVTEISTLSKLGKILKRADNAIAYQNIILKTLQQVRDRLDINIEEKFFRPAIIVITSNRGFCGAYNHNVYQQLDAMVKAYPNAKLLVIGKQGLAYANNHNYDVEHFFDLTLEDINLEELANISTLILNEIYAEKFDSLFCVYTHYQNVRTTKATSVEIYPSLPSLEDDNDLSAILDFDDDIDELEDFLVENYVTGYLYSLVLYSVASEYIARKEAMGQAKKSVEDKIEDKTYLMNKNLRYQKTNELFSIITSAQVLEEEE